jgi:hypothetical protein
MPPKSNQSYSEYPLFLVNNTKKKKSKYINIFLKKYNIHLLLPTKESKDEDEQKIEYPQQSNPEEESKSELESLLEETIQKELSSNQNLEYLIYGTKHESDTKSIYTYSKNLQDHKNHPTPKIYKSEVDPVSGASIHYVSSSDLPGNAVGMYVPSTNTIYVSLDQSPREIEVTKHHEIYHARHGSDETQAEAYGQRMAA